MINGHASFGPKAATTVLLCSTCSQELVPHFPSLEDNLLHYKLAGPGVRAIHIQTAIESVGSDKAQQINGLPLNQCSTKAITSLTEIGTLLLNCSLNCQTSMQLHI